METWTNKSTLIWLNFLVEFVASIIDILGNFATHIWNTILHLWCVIRSYSFTIKQSPFRFFNIQHVTGKSLPKFLIYHMIFFLPCMQRQDTQGNIWTINRNYFIFYVNKICLQYFLKAFNTNITTYTWLNTNITGQNKQTMFN